MHGSAVILVTSTIYEAVWTQEILNVMGFTLDRNVGWKTCLTFAASLLLNSALFNIMFQKRMPFNWKWCFSLSESDPESDIASRWFVRKFSGLNTLSSDMDKEFPFAFTFAQCKGIGCVPIFSDFLCDFNSRSRKSSTNIKCKQTRSPSALERRWD